MSKKTAELVDYDADQDQDSAEDGPPIKFMKTNASEVMSRANLIKK